MARRSGLGTLLIGGAIGAGIALLFAPKKGEELRKDLLEKISDLCDRINELDEEDVKVAIENKVKEIKKGIEDLDSEKVKNIAIEKGEVLKEKSAELVEFAKEKGTPALEKTARAVKLETTKVVKEVLKKLEEE